MPKASINEHELNNMINEINHARSEKRVSRLFTDQQVNYLNEKYREHLDSDAPGQPKGISPSESEETNFSLQHPDSVEKDKQARYGVKHEFDDEQVGFLKKVEE